MTEKEDEDLPAIPDSGLVQTSCLTCNRLYWVYHRHQIAKCNMCEKPHEPTYVTKMFFGRTQ